MKKLFEISGATTKIDSMVDFFIQKINRTPLFIILFFVLVGNFLTFIPDGNEENYLQLSKQFINPHWIEHSFSLTEFAGTRLLYQYICGFLLQYISFELLTFLGKFGIIIWYAATLARLFKKIQLTPIFSLFLLQGLFFFKQSAFGGENIFLGFEPKHFAYCFILCALNTFLGKKYLPATLFVVVASWFHILVGAWFFVAYILYLLVTKEVVFKYIVLYCFVYGMLLLPFALFLANEIILHSTGLVHAVSADWIYSVFRNPHHTAIFSSLDYFYDNHAIGVLWSMIIGICTLIIFPKYVPVELKRINTFVAVISCLLFLNVCISFFDRGGHFVKYYPFRLASVQLFLFYVLLMTFIKEYFSKQQLIGSVAFVITVLFFTLYSALNVFKMVRFVSHGNSAFYEMTAYIKAHTANDAVIYYSEKAENFTLSFTREAQRDRFIIYKFVPAGTNKIYDWYERIQAQTKIDQNPSLIFEVKKKFKIDYVLTTDSIGVAGFIPIKKIDDYRLYAFE